MADLSSQSGIPDDLIPGYKAAILLGCSPRTVRRRSERGELRRFRRDVRSGYYYSQAEVESLRRYFYEVTEPKE